MRAIAQRFRRDGEDFILDDLGWSAIVGHFNARDVGLPARAYIHVPRLADHRVNGDAAKRRRRRQCGNLEFNSLDGLRSRFIDRANGERMCPRRQIRRVYAELQAVARHQRAKVGLDAQACNWRLTLHRDGAANRVADHRLRTQPLDLKTRRQRLHFKDLLNRGRLSAGVGGADA